MNVQDSMMKDMNEALTGLEKEITYTVNALEIISRKYGKGGFIPRLMNKKGYGDFTKEGLEIAEKAEELLAIIEEEFVFTVANG